MNAIHVEKRYLSFSSEIHAEGSNTAVSYVAALNKMVVSGFLRTFDSD